MNANLQFVSILVAACVSILLSLPATAPCGFASGSGGRPDAIRTAGQDAAG